MRHLIATMCVWIAEHLEPTLCIVTQRQHGDGRTTITIHTRGHRLVAAWTLENT